MTQAEKDQKQAELRALVAEHQTKAQMFEDQWRALDATPVTTYKVWEPKDRQNYWRSCLLDDLYFNTDVVDSKYLECGLAHPTPEAAARHHEFLVMLRQLEKFAVEHNEGWKPDWNIHIAKYNVVLEGYNLRVGRANYAQLTILPYLKTDELAQKAIDTFGDRLKILFEYYNS